MTVRRVTWVSGTGSGWTVTHSDGVVTATRTTSITGGASAPFTVTVAVGSAAVPSVTNRAWVSGGGELSDITADNMGVTALVEYYDGSVWSYTPVSAGCGAPSDYDACVSRLRWSLQAPLANSAQGTATFAGRVK
ncbi:hypothetical protein BH23GEM2_BH23GEM2_24070 [soil metagenome]